MPTFFYIFGVLLVAAATSFPWQSAESDLGWAFLTLIFAVPLLILSGLICMVQTFRRIMQRILSPKKAAFYSVGLFGISSLIYCVIWFHLHPSSISYTFQYGQSGSYTEVWFTHTENGKEIEGPWVGTFPLQVRFPDLNHDGYRDIRVTGNGNQVVEYIYLPQNDGKRFWHLQTQKGFGARYAPDDELRDRTSASSQ